MRVQALSADAIPARLRETSGRLSFLLLASRGNKVVVLGSPVVCESPTCGQHDILLGAYAGEIGQRTAKTREQLWHQVIGAGTCDAHGYVLNWRDDLGAVETPLKHRQNVSEVLSRFLESKVT